MSHRPQGQPQPATHDSWVLEGYEEPNDSLSPDPENSSEEERASSMLNSNYQNKVIPPRSSPGLVVKGKSRRDAVRTMKHRPGNAYSHGPPTGSEEDMESDLVMPLLSVSSMGDGTGSYKKQPRTPTGSSTARSIHLSSRRLRRTDKPSQTSVDSPRSTSKRRSKAVHDTTSMSMADVLIGVLTYVATTISMILKILRPWVAYVVAFWILAYLARLLFTSTITRALAPVCMIPGIGYFEIPFCTVSKARGPAEFEQLMTVQSAFEDVLSSSTKDAQLPLDMKRGESSIRDLKYVVQYSSLPSRNELVFEFTGFLDTARQASADLSRFNSRVGRAVDHILSTNKWTLQILDDAAEREVSRGAVSRFLQNTFFVPFQSARLTEDLVLDQYLRHTRAIEDQIAELIIEAKALLDILTNLDDRLDVIQSITTRDGVRVQGSRDELFSHLWTKLGGNRSSRKKHEDQLQLLKEVNLYRKTAWEHVSATVVKLQTISAGLEDLRERVAAPEVLHGGEAVPLRMHIEHIQLGLDRLEEQRIEAKQAQGEQYRHLLDKGGSSEDLRYLDGHSKSRVSIK